MVVQTLPPAQDPPRSIKMDSWPTLGEAFGGAPAAAPEDAAPAGQADGGDDWEFISPDGPGDDEAGGDSGMAGRGSCSNPKILHRSASTPDFGNYDAYTESSSEGEGGEEEENDDDTKVTTVTDASSAVLVPAATAAKPSTSAWGPPDAAPGGKGTSVRRVPSFRDAILLNAEKADEEAAAAAAHRAETEARLRKEREAHRKARARRTRLVVTPIKRCAKSTGDLKGLVSIHEHEEDGFGYGGGGSGGGGIAVGPIAEHDDEHGAEEILGDTDAMEFYHRKAKGHQNRKSGLMERPDEAKRKEISMYKKEAQRKKQQERQAQQGGGGGKAKGGKGGKENSGGSGKGGKGGGGGRKR